MNSDIHQQLSWNFDQILDAANKKNWKRAIYVSLFVDGILTALLKTKQIDFSTWQKYRDMIEPFLKNII